MRYRLGTTEDLPAALTLLRAQPTFRAPDAVWAQMLPAWRRWLADDQLGFIVWEDPRRPAAERLRSVGMSLVVSDPFTAETLASPEPYPARRLYTLAASPDSPVLPLDAVGRANAGNGINLFVLHNPMRIHDLAHPDQAELLPLGPQGFYFGHAGYYVKNILWECYGREHIDFLVAGGFSLLNSYGRGHPEIIAAGAPFRPFLGGLRRPVDLEAGYDPIRLWMFNRAHPLLALTQPQQRMLRFALLGYTDRELEAVLGVSSNALKQRWARVYEQMTRVFPPDVLEAVAELHAESHAESRVDSGDGNGGTASRPVKRHHVLDYLRQNMHELRPYAHDKGDRPRGSGPERA